MKKLLFILLIITTSIGVAQTTAIPDANFEQALIDLGYDTGSPDGVVPTANVDTIISLYIWAKNISDLTGIQDFSSLVELNCEANQFASIDVSHNLNLKVLVTANNFQLINLDVSQNTLLTYLNCAASPSLSSIDVRNGNNANFTYFNVQVDSSLRCIYVDDKNATYLSSWLKDTSAHWVNDTLDCQNITSFNEYYDQNNFFNIYPNPSSEYAVFELEQYPVQLTIYDLHNKVVLSEHINQKLFKLNTSGFDKGIYFCHLFSDGLLSRKKLIII
ncbi:MAG: hypothetical protein KFKLKKLM_02344 [Flavobacteriales bacterium]|nr:T9SS type A sorting domain-containing protein [Flavobacteriales bacterium]MBV6485747.1 hypothetical protein [Flavobacteriales bacterium]